MPARALKLVSLVFLAAGLAACSERGGGGVRTDADPVGPRDGAPPDAGPPDAQPDRTVPDAQPDAKPDTGDTGGGSSATHRCDFEDLGTSLGIDLATGTTAGENHFDPRCSESDAPDKIYVWEAPAAGTFTIDTQGSSFDTALHIYDGTCDGAELGCNDDAGSASQSTLHLTLTAGQKVAIVVDGWGREVGDFKLSITEGGGAEAGACDDDVDNDRDGAVDCDDSECAEGPGCAEVNCSDGLDDDGDGDVDCADYECYYHADCTEDGAECTDGLDNDGDGEADCNDYDCEYEDVCQETNCSDGIDDEGDGDIDCADYDCYYEEACQETGAECTDGLDNDGDGEADCADYDCEYEDACEENNCGDGIDDESDGAIDCDDYDCSGDAACHEAGMCGDTTDNDSDGSADCADSECRCDPACMTGSCPANDLGSAVGAAVATGSTAGVCNSFTGSCASWSTAPDMAYKWTAPAAGAYTFDTETSAFDTVLYVLDGSCTGAELECDDDGGESYHSSKVTLTVTAGQVLVVVVDGYSSSTGDYVLNIKEGS